jgi:hemoglobin-like flavoprotein
MARIKRKTVELNEDSLKNLIQEVYNDSHQIRSTIVALFNNWNSKVKEQGEIAATGKEIVNLINALARNQDQKINLIKVLNDIVFVKTDKKNSDDSKKSTTANGEGDLSEEAKASLRKMIEEAKERGEIDI